MITGSSPIGANISAYGGESLVPRPLPVIPGLAVFVITGLDPVIHRGAHIVRRGMEELAQAMTLRGWRNTAHAPRGNYVSAYEVEPGDDGREAVATGSGGGGRRH